MRGEPTPSCYRSGGVKVQGGGGQVIRESKDFVNSEREKD